MRHAVYPRRSRLAIAGWHGEKRAQFIAASPAGPRDPSHAGNTGASSTVETLAQRVHMSRASFAQLFRDVSATTPLAVLTTLRLQIAAQTLSREALPVMVIAESVGYASESSFHKAFVREFGCTPGEYRKRVNALGR